jgi:hypothetical protein
MIHGFIYRIRVILCYNNNFKIREKLSDLPVGRQISSTTRFYRGNLGGWKIDRRIPWAKIDSSASEAEQDVWGKIKEERSGEIIEWQETQ